MANLPEVAKRARSTILMRWIMQFHAKFIARLRSDNIVTLRNTAWQIEAYLEEHGSYYDAEFIRTLQHSIEKVAQQKSPRDTDWTVAKASVSLLGRTRGVNQHAKKSKEYPRPKPAGSSKIIKQINDQMSQKSGRSD